MLVRVGYSRRPKRYVHAVKCVVSLEVALNSWADWADVWMATAYVAFFSLNFFNVHEL